MFLWYYFLTEKRTDLETSNTEMVTISRAEYEAMQARLSGLEEQLRSKTEELAETLLKNQWLLENLKLTKKKLFGESSEQLDQMVIEKFGHLFNEAEGWDASSYEEEFLDGFSGWLHADGYQGYRKLPERIRVVGCAAHARRKFDEALTALPKEQQQTSKAAEALCYFAKLFQLEQSFAELKPEERYTKRLEQAKPVLDALLVWANDLFPRTAPKSALGKALHYLKEQWPYLVRYLEDGRLELSNNRAERSIKPFVMGRKGWLFSNTPAGAQASAVIYSLIETAKENVLDPYRYLLWVLESAPAMALEGDAWAGMLTPANAPETCKIPKETQPNETNEY